MTYFPDKITESGMGTWRRTHYSGDITEDDHGGSVTVAGWAQEIRKFGGLIFLKLRDRSGVVQVTLDKGDTDPDIFNAAENLSRESAVMFRGEIRKNERAPSGFEIVPEAMRVPGAAGTPLPLGVVDKVFAEMDTRLDHRFLDLRKRDAAAVFKIRDNVVGSIERALRRKSFIQVHTPCIVSSASEGGAELFEVDYFGETAYLNQSPQLYKQTLMGAGFDRVFEIAPAFRAELHDTVRHLNEFISVDIEMSFSDENDAMDVLEDMVRSCVAEAAEMTEETGAINDGRKTLNKLLNKVNMNIGAQNKRIKKENQGRRSRGEDPKPLLKPEKKYDTLRIDPIDGPIPRVKYEECLEIARDGGVAVDFGDDLSMEAMRAVEREYPGYHFITHWPTSIKPFYVQPYESSPEVCRAFDLNKGRNEIASGAQRVHDPERLRNNLAEQGLDPEDFTSYLEPFKYGMPPHAGWGLGLERLMMVLLDVRNVREVVLFPRDRNRLTP